MFYLLSHLDIPVSCPEDVSVLFYCTILLKIKLDLIRLLRYYNFCDDNYYYNYNKLMLFNVKCKLFFGKCVSLCGVSVCGGGGGGGVCLWWSVATQFKIFLNL